MDRMLSTRVEAELERRVTALATRRGVTRSALVRRLLEDAVAPEQEVHAA